MSKFLNLLIYSTKKKAEEFKTDLLNLLGKIKEGHKDDEKGEASIEEFRNDVKKRLIASINKEVYGEDQRKIIGKYIGEACIAINETDSREEMQKILTYTEGKLSTILRNITESHS